jgi:hypothetical protein
VTRALPVLALFACAPTTPETPFAAGPWPEAPRTEPAYELQALVGPLTLAVGELHPGGVAALTAGNADPGEVVYFAASLGGVGNGPCYGLLGGLCLELGSRTVYAGSAVADGLGMATLEVPVSPSLPTGQRVAFQAAVRRGAGGSASEKSGPEVLTVGDPAWSNAAVVDGDLAEWSPEERFGTTSADGRSGGITWDRRSLFVAFDHPDVSGGGSLHWEVVYLAAGGPGTTTGPVIGSQAAELPFEADLVLRRKADGSYDDLLVWDDALASWVSTPGILATPGWSAAESGDTLELAVPRSLLGNTLSVATAQVYEGSGFESTYGGVPARAFVDGFDPDLGAAVELDLSSPDPAGLQYP